MLLLFENSVILTSVVLSQYTRVSDDDRLTQHTMTIAGHCNEIATFDKNETKKNRITRVNDLMILTQLNCALDHRMRSILASSVKRTPNKHPI